MITLFPQGNGDALASMKLVRAYGERWIAAGDAAQSFDPLSSQGIMTAIVGGNNAAAALVAAHSTESSVLEKLQADLDARYASYSQRTAGLLSRRTTLGGSPVLATPP